MKCSDELINNIVNQALPHGTPEEKKKRFDDIKNMITKEGLPPTPEMMGITPEVIQRLHAFAFQLYNNGRYQEALTLYANLAVMDPDNFDFAFGFAACLHMMKKYQDAINGYIRSSHLDVTNPIPLFHLGDCYMQMNNNDSAILALGLAEKISGDIPKYAELKKLAIFTRDRLEQQKKEPEAKGAPETTMQKSQTSVK